MHHQAIWDHFLWSSLHQTWYQALPCEGTCLPRPSNPWQPNKVKILFRSYYLLPIISDLSDKIALLKSMNHQLGLEPIKTFSISATKSLNLAMTTQHNPSILWQGEAHNHPDWCKQVWPRCHFGTGQPPHSLCQQDHNRHWDKICQYRKGLSIHMYWPWEVPYRHLQKTCHHTKWPQALQDDTA